jgi:hypothetical protein
LSDIDGYESGPCWIGSNTVIENKLNTDPEIKTWFRTTFHEKFFTKSLPFNVLSWLKFTLYSMHVSFKKRGNNPYR